MTAIDARRSEPAAWPAQVEGGRPLRRAVIDAAALRRNAAALCRHVGPAVAVMAMVKANGYGHGAVIAARSAVAGGARWLGVSSPEEALQLREAGLEVPVLNVGWSPPSFHRALIDAAVDMAVFDPASARAIAASAGDASRPARVHIKVDTGMGRLGVRPEEYEALLDVVLRSAPSTVLAGVFTHFADADGVDAAFTEVQHSRFAEALRAARSAEPSVLGHCANSAATLRYRSMHHDIVRPGIALYGYAPPGAAGVVELRPAMTVLATVTQVKTVQPGDTVGYGRTWTALTPRRIATVAAGYADGVSRAQSNRGQVMVSGRRCPIVGRVSMDQLTADVTAAGPVSAGEEAVILGGTPGTATWLGADEVAAAVDTISYEALCAVSARVPRQIESG